MTAFAELLLYASLRISLVAAGVALTLMAARVRSGAVRHSAWAAVLGAMVLMPILPYCVPTVAISLPAASRVSEIVPFVTEVPTPSGVREISSPPTGRVAEISVPQAPRQRALDWTWVAFGVYGLVAVALLVRLVVGWGSARRLARESALVLDLSNERTIYESRLIAVPLTIGVFAPRITLPMGWRDWPDGKLRAVLAHERAHVQRRDALIGLLANLNRCVFCSIRWRGGWSGISRRLRSTLVTMPGFARWGNLGGTRRSCWTWRRRCDRAADDTPGRASEWMAQGYWGSGSIAS